MYPIIASAPSPWLAFAAEAFTALGTIGAVVVALWLAWRDKYQVPKLTLERYPIEPSIITTKRTDNTHQKECIFHLLVRNERPLYAAINCRVNVVAIRERVGDEWLFHHVAVPLQLKWPRMGASGNAAPPVNITNEAAVDFGSVSENASFRLSLYFRPGSFSDSSDVAPTKTRQFILEVTADNFCPSEQFVVEVYWTGVWSDSGKQMEANLPITVKRRASPKISGIGTRS